MNRSLIILLGALTLGSALFGSAYALSQRVCRLCDTPPAGSVAWLREEYHLNGNQMARIQKLHEDYMSRCAAMCRMVADKKQAVETALENSTNPGSDAGQKLADLAACRADCQTQVLQYFISVSQIMPPEAGRHYLADMTKNAFRTADRSPEDNQPMSIQPEHGTH